MDSDEFNPYAAPESDERRDTLTEFYRIDYRRMTYREHWRISAGVLPFLILAPMKTLRLPARGLFPNAIPKLTRLDVLTHGDVPPEVWDAWGQALKECADHQITLSLISHTPTLGAGLSNYYACLLSDDELTSVYCTYLRVQRGRVDRVVVGYGVTSMLQDGRYAQTSGVREAFEGTRQYVTQRLPGATVARLLEAHRAWVPTLGPPIVRMPRATHADRVLAASKVQFDELVKRKLYVPISEKEFEAIARQPESPESVAPPPENMLDRLIRCVVGILALVLIGQFLAGYLVPQVDGFLGTVVILVLLLSLVVLVYARKIR